jgi:hypothetical protein
LGGRILEYWVEENVRPNTPEDMDRVILEHVGPIVKFLKRKGWLENWHFLRESQNWRNQTQLVPHIRFRIKTKSNGDLENVRNFVKAALDGLQQVGRIADHYRGNHGNLSQEYLGESGGFDETRATTSTSIRTISQGWSLIQIWWQTGSEIELLFLQNRFRGVQLGPRFLLPDMLHFFANQCGRPNSLMQGDFFLIQT